MTIALDHTPTGFIASRLTRLVRALRAKLSALHHYWFVECVGPSDPLSPMTQRDWADMPTWHPASEDELRLIERRAVCRVSDDVGGRGAFDSLATREGHSVATAHR